jgi:hypothetical protein
MSPIERTAGGGGGGGALTTADATLSGDVTIVTANTFYDGPSASFAAGTWFICWTMLVVPIVGTAQNYFWTVKLWDGTTIYDEGEVTTGAYSPAVNQNGWLHTISGQAVVVLGSTTSLKLSATEGHGPSASKMLRDVTDNPGNSHTATRLCGVKVA